MYYAKYIKYKNKYLNLKHQLAGAPTVVGRIINIKPSHSLNPQPLKPVYSLKQKLLKSKLKNINIPSVYENLENIDKSLKENLVGIKILEADSVHLEPIVKYNQKFKTNPVYFYRFRDTDGNVYILCSLYSYFEFLDILYEHIEIEEINIDEKGILIPKLGRIYHIIPKPKDIEVKPKQTISLPIKPNIYSNLKNLVDDLSSNFFIIINYNQLLLKPICMYNLFIGTIHVFVININKSPSTFFLLSLFTEYELMQYIEKQPNIELYECRLYKQGDKIEFKLNKVMVAMMFDKYQGLKPAGYYAKKLIRGNPAIDNQLLDQLDIDLIDKCSRCISVEDIAFNTTLFLFPEKISDIIKDKEILEIKKYFVEKEYYLLNNNNKNYHSDYGKKDLDRLREFNFEEIEKEIEVLKKKLLGLEPCHKELLVKKLNDLGFDGNTMNEILEKNALCYLKKADKDKKLLYEHSIQIDKDTKFVRERNFNPEMKRLLETSKNPESELHKYRQTILFLRKGTKNENKYKDNQSYFFIDSFYLSSEILKNQVFEPLGWTINLNKLCFQCLAMRDWLIFPIRIINIEYLQSPFSFEFDIKKQEFCGFIHTRFTDDFNGNKDFNNACADKLLFLYSNTYDTNRYRLFHFTGNSVYADVSILSNYKVSSIEINWIYYTFILKYRTIPYFYQYINEYGEIEILVSKFTLKEILQIYIENNYDVCELELLIEVFYNYLYNKRENLNPIFIKKSLFISEEQENKFIEDVIKKNTKL